MAATTPEVSAWQPPLADGMVISRHRRGEDLRGLEREAWQAGFADGKDAALRAAREERQRLLGVLQDQTSRLQDILDYLAQPLAELSDSVQQQLVRMCALIARQVVRRELAARPEEVVGAVREALALLPPATRNMQVHLHPEDARLVRERLAESATRSWQIAEDPVLTRGGCLVTTEYSTVDSRLEQRIGAAVAQALGDLRDTRVPPQSPETTLPGAAT